MPIKRGRKSLQNLGDYARKRIRHDAVEIEDSPEADTVEEIEFEEPVSVEPEPEPEPELSSTSDSDDGLFDGPEDAEDLLMQDDKDVEELFSQLENHFSKTLRTAQACLQNAEKLKSRPSTYCKINPKNPKTLFSRRKKAAVDRQAMRDKGYPNIRTLFERRRSLAARNEGSSSESDNEIEEIDNLLTQSDGLVPSQEGEESFGESAEMHLEGNASCPAPSLFPLVALGPETPGHSWPEGETPEVVMNGHAGAACGEPGGAEGWNLPEAYVDEAPNEIEQPGPTSEPPLSIATSPGPEAPVFTPKQPSRPPPKTSLALAEAVRTLGHKARRTELNPVLRGRVVAMLAFLRFYTTLSLGLNWTEASELAAVGAGKGKALARKLREWVGLYLQDPESLPKLRCANVQRTLVEDEDIAQEIKLHLLSLGKYFTAMDIVKYSAQADVAGRWGLTRPISESTATRWLQHLDYRYQNEKKGYADGHEREDVVRYRQDVFLKEWFRPQERMVVRDDEGKVVKTPPNPLLLLIPITHDESTFYAHDQRKKRWVHKSEGAVPVRKGEGTSLMVSDFCSPDLPGGWLRSKDGTREARVIFKAGKNRDGYFDNDNVLESTRNAIDIFETHHPPESGVKALFLFDNAKTHSKRADDALSARKMPKSTRLWLPRSGVKMRNGSLPNGEAQPLWFPDDHPDPKKAGMFKGMEVILRERGLWPARGLRAECEGFKCATPDTKTDCCARRLLFTQPDFVNQKSKLQEFVEGRGHHFLFYPKFHCELNFIEMCWGRAKFEYRMYGIPRNEEQQEEYVRKALDSVSPSTINRFANRSARFMDAYRQGLSGSQAAWAGRKYHGHRTLPPEFVAEVKQRVN
ncbi:hypothetical protein FRC01_003742 [Tulasnella sp. 417]|nr:hypothetical protein FRC01_003742 [Tulasnella sp. 417]